MSGNTTNVDASNVNLNDLSQEQRQQLASSIVKAVGMPRMIKMTLEQKAKMAEILK